MLLPLALLAACGASSPTSTPTEPTPPTSGWLTLQLATPSSNDGAVQFAISGPAIDSVSIIGYDGFAAADHGTVNLVVTGQIGNGDIARIHVADLSATNQYHATVAAAAARVTYALTALDGYRAVLVR
jgi:hypothetical protein